MNRLICLLFPGAPFFFRGQVKQGICAVTAALAPVSITILLATISNLFLPALLLVWVLLHCVVTWRFCACETGGESEVCLRPALGRGLLVTSLLPLLAMVITVTHLFDVHAMTLSTAYPTVQVGDWITSEPLDPDRELERGEPVVVACDQPGVSAVLRILGLPGDVVTVEPGRICDSQGCLPTPGIGNLVTQGAVREDLRGVVEVQGGRFHTVLWPVSSLPGKSEGPASSTGGAVADGYVVLPDDRRPGSLRSCREHPVVPREAIIGTPRHVLSSAKLQRVGLEIH